MPQSLFWDFFDTRSDGTTVRFHTKFTQNKVEVAKVDGAQANHELRQPPAKGKGRSDGPGTYKRKTQGNYDESVRSSQTHHGGGDGSAVAEPPGLPNDEPDQSDGWRKDAWSDWQDWNSDSGWKPWGHSKKWQEWEWQEWGSSATDGQRVHK